MGISSEQFLNELIRTGLPWYSVLLGHERRHVSMRFACDWYKSAAVWMDRKSIFFLVMKEEELKQQFQIKK